MAEINNVVLSGRMSKDIEIRYIEDKIVGNFILALNETYSDSSKTNIEKVHFFECVAFGKIVELISQYCKKGDSIIISGKLTQIQYRDKNNSLKSKIKVFVETFKLMPTKKQSPNLQPQIIYEGDY